MLGTGNEHKCSSPAGGHSSESVSSHLRITMQYGRPALKKKFNAMICGQVATPRWESKTNILLGYNSKLSKMPRDCHNNNSDTENTVF